MNFFENPFKKSGGQGEPKELPLNKKPNEGIIIESPKEEKPTAPNAPTPEGPKTESPLQEEVFPER